MFTQRWNVSDTNRCKRNSFISFFCSIIFELNKALLNIVFCKSVIPGICGISL